MSHSQGPTAEEKSEVTTLFRRYQALLDDEKPTPARTIARLLIQKRQLENALEELIGMARPTTASECARLRAASDLLDRLGR